MGLLSSIKSFLGLGKKEEVLQEVSNEMFLEAVRKTITVEASKPIEQLPVNAVEFPVTTPDPVVVDTKDVNETLNGTLQEPKKEKKVLVKKEVAKEKPVAKKPAAEKQKAKKTK